MKYCHRVRDLRTLRRARENADYTGCYIKKDVTAVARRK